MKLLLIGLTLAVLAAGCARSNDAPAAPTQALPTSTAPAPTPTQTQSRNQPTSNTPTGTASACPNKSLEDCFSYTQMSSFLDAVEPMVAQYFQSQFPKLPSPNNVVYIPHGRAAASRCGGASNSLAYEYCPADQRIFIGQDLLWAFYNQAGDAAPVIALAHEWGHHIQNWMDVPFPRTAAESVNYENQADCVAGSFADYAGGQGWLESDDLDDVETLLANIGSDGAGRDHGNAAERAAAFQLGYESGIKGCNSFSPNAKLA